jgi:hypothetical protein
MKRFIGLIVGGLILFGTTSALAQAGGICGVQPLPDCRVNDTGSGGGSVSILPTAVTPTDDGGTITLGGTSQTAIASNTSRKGCWIQNPVSATEDLYVSSTAAAVTTAGTPDDADLAPGGSWSCLQGGNIITAAIRVNAVTTGHAYIAKSTQ